MHGTNAFTHPTIPSTVFFTRNELNAILNLYGRKVAAGEWRDYAIDFGREKAVFSVFRRASEVPLYRIEKNPRLARRQGAYSVVAATGLILKRGHDSAACWRSWRRASGSPPSDAQLLFLAPASAHGYSAAPRVVHRTR